MQPPFAVLSTSHRPAEEVKLLPGSHNWVSDAVKNRDPGKEEGAFLGLRSEQAGLHLSSALAAALVGRERRTAPLPPSY